jgi:uncharacterized protein (TIGR02246 family)
MSNEILNTLETYSSALFDKDSAAFLKLYHPDVRVFDLWGNWIYDGAAAWREVVGHWFGSLGTERAKATFDDVRLTETPALATISAIVTYEGQSASGEKLRDMQNRVTWVLAPHEGAWKIIHEHTSAPIGDGDLKAILQRAAKS